MNSASLASAGSRRLTTTSLLKPDRAAHQRQKDVGHASASELGEQPVLGPHRVRELLAHGRRILARDVFGFSVDVRRGNYRGATERSPGV